MSETYTKADLLKVWAAALSLGTYTGLKASVDSPDLIEGCRETEARTAVACGMVAMGFAMTKDRSSAMRIIEKAITCPSEVDAAWSVTSYIESKESKS